MKQNKEMLYSYYRIRKIIGLLGLLLPVLVVLFYGEILSSLSHYYYTRSAVFFIAILSAFGLFLISYKGYERDKQTEWLSDNFITHIAGIAVLIVVLFPTDCSGSHSPSIDGICASADYPLFGHQHALKSWIHFIGAGLFLFCMGWMSIFRFTKGDINPSKQRKNKIYRLCGYIIWASIAILLLEFIVKNWFSQFQISDYDVFIFETISVFSFGISWLIKGEAIKDLIDFKIFLLQHNPAKKADNNQGI